MIIIWWYCHLIWKLRRSLNLISRNLVTIRNSHAMPHYLILELEKGVLTRMDRIGDMVSNMILEIVSVFEVDFSVYLKILKPY